MLTLQSYTNCAIAESESGEYSVNFTCIIAQNKAVQALHEKFLYDARKVSACHLCTRVHPFTPVVTSCDYFLHTLFARVFLLYNLVGGCWRTL